MKACIFSGLGLVVLHGLSTLPIPHLITTSPSDWSGSIFCDALTTISPDLLLAIGVGATLLLFRWSRNVVTGVLAAFWILAVAYRVIAAIPPAHWGTPFDLYAHLGEGFGLVHALFQGGGWTSGILVGIGVVAGLGIAWWCLSRVASWALPRGQQGLVILLLLVQGLWGWSWWEGPPGRHSGRWVGAGAVSDLVAEVGETLRSQVWRSEDFWQQIMADRVRIEASLDSGLQALKDVDVYVLFLESYGRVSHELPGFGTGWLAPLEAQLEGSRFQAVSTYGYPSIRGGMSSLAHMELLAGIPVPLRSVFEFVLRSPLRPLSRCFQDAGHHTVSVSPAMPYGWPEGMAFYGFDRELTAESLEYDGHVYHWGRVPDQFALASVLKHVVRPATDPLFLLYVSVTSHAPFAQVPPYIEDWNLAATDVPFRGSPARDHGLSFMSYLNSPVLATAYMDSIAYSMRSAVGFALQLQRPSLVIILGDHQPPGFLAASDDPKARAVPIHVLSNRPSVIEGLGRIGFLSGLSLPAEHDAGPFYEFRDAFLNHFAGEGR